MLDNNIDSGQNANLDRTLFFILGGCGIVLVCSVLSLIMFIVGVFRFGNEPPVTDIDSTLEAVLTSEPLPETLPPPEQPTLALTPATPVNLPPQGRIAYTCQIFRERLRDQICLMNADGSGWRRLTRADFSRHFYPSIAPDGRSVVFSSNMSGQFELYEQQIESGELRKLTDNLGIPTAPEISPDGKSIAFSLGDEVQNVQVWVMDRDGSNPRQLTPGQGWDPTWSPDGQQLLFATYVNTAIQLMVVNSDGSDMRQVTNLDYLRGRSDWSNDNRHFVTYSGQAWERELVLMDTSGANSRQLTPPGGNSQGPSFSPDGQWVAFTAYFDLFRDENGCEIYIIRIDGSGLRRLTDNNYCDWQPRWGP